MPIPSGVVFCVVLGLISTVVRAQSGSITVGTFPAAPSIAFQQSTPIFSSWIPIFATWTDITRQPTSVTIQIDANPNPGVVFITSTSSTPSATQTLTLSGTSLLDNNAPAGYFAYALIQPPLDPSSTSATNTGTNVRLQITGQADWTSTTLNFPVSVLKRPVKISTINTNAAAGGFDDVAGTIGSTISLVPGVLSTPITIEFLVPPQSPITSVTVAIDSQSTTICGVTSTGTQLACPNNFYSYVVWTPDSNTPPTGAAATPTPGSATWNAVPTGTRKLTFQIVANPSLSPFQPFEQQVVYQTQLGRYPNLAWFPSTNGSAGSGQYFVPQLRLTLTGGEAGQYNPAVATNVFYLFNPIASINQVPIFLDNVATPSILTGLSKTFTYRSAHVFAGQSVSYQLFAPPGITVTPSTISFNCPALVGAGPNACPTTQTVVVAVDPNLQQNAYSTVQIFATQPSATLNVAYPRTIPGIQFNIVDRYTDNEILVDNIPSSVALGQSFTFSVRTRIAPATGVVLTARFISSEFSFDQPTYTLSATNTGFMVTATALNNNLFKTLTYPAAQPVGSGYTTGSEAVSVFGFITAIWTGPNIRNYLNGGIWDSTNANFGTIQFGPSRTNFENLPAAGIEIYRPRFNYQTATILNSGTYAITTFDQPSAAITLALLNAPPTGGVSVTPVINCAYVFASPATMVFSTSTNVASFTLTADRNGYQNTPFQSGACTVSFSLSGESALFYTAPAPFTVTVPTAQYVFTPVLEGGLTNTNGAPLRTFQIGVTPNFLPRGPSGTVTLQPFWALGTISPASLTWSSGDTAFTKTFVVTETNEIDPSVYTGASVLAKLQTITWSLTGPDAGYYTIAPLNGPAHAQRSITLPATTSMTVGSYASVIASLSDAPTTGTLILTPKPNVPNAITFNPPSFTWTAGSATAAIFEVFGNNIGSWYVEWELTGTDSYLYTSGAAAAQSSTFTVSARGGVSVAISSPGGFFSGFTYGPFSAQIASYDNSALTSTSLTITPTSDDWVFDPPTLAFQANGISAPFRMRYNPSSALVAAHSAIAFTTVIEFNLAGDDAWQYAIPAKQQIPVTHRSITFTDENGGSTPALASPTGIPVLMWVLLPEGPVPSSGITVTLSSDTLVFAQGFGAAGPNGTSAGSSSLDVQFSGDIVRQQVLVWTNVAGGWGHARNGFPDTSNAKFSIYTTVTGADAVHYVNPTNLINVFTLVKKLFYFDANSLVAQWENTLNSDATVPQIPVGQTSLPISVGTIGLVQGSVTLTPVCGHVPGEAFSGTGYSGCPYFSFTPAELVFSGSTTQTLSFTMTARGIAPKGAPVRISWSVTGPDAASWDILITGASAPLNAVPNELPVQPVPHLLFSPMPALPIDGRVDNLVVTLNQPTTDFPPFQLLITATASVGGAQTAGVVINPDIIQFGPGSALANTWGIVHARPAQIAPSSHSYTLNYFVKYQGATTAIRLLPRVVPVDVSEVRVIRYAIIPDFPTVLGLSWLPASINLTRAPWGDVALIPHLPNYNDAQVNVGASPGGSSYYPNENQVGLKAPGGRVIFNPPAITFLAGQLVSEFRVRADRLSDNEALYLRVDWEPVFHAEDVNCYYPFAFTWHIAAASTSTLAWALVVALASLLLL